EPGVRVANLGREGLGAEGAEGLHARVAAVPDAVLRGVAMYDEGGARAGAAGGHGGVATDAGRHGRRVSCRAGGVRVAPCWEGSAGDGQGVAGQGRDGADADPVDRQDLADHEAGARPRDTVVAAEGGRTRTAERADDLDEGVATAVDGGDATVDR